MILLTGASGFLGKILFRTFSSYSETTGLCYSNQCSPAFLQADISDPSRLLHILNSLNPEFIVHSAAWRDPERCEKDPAGARKLHVDATALMAEWCNQQQRCLVYISTDYVFDGTKPPYHESDPVSPVSVYGETKAAGECAARIANEHIIVRIPLQYGFSQVPDDSFIIKVLEKLASNTQIKLDYAQLRHPTLGDDVARAIILLRNMKFTGIIHLCGPTAITRYEMWQTIADMFECDRSLISALPEPEKFLAARPNDSRMSTELYASLGLPPFHSFSEGLMQVKQQMMVYGYDWLRK